jgi:hypothetical protein
MLYLIALSLVLLVQSDAFSFASSSRFIQRSQKLTMSTETPVEVLKDAASKWRLQKCGQGNDARYGLLQVPSNTFFAKTETITVSTDGGIGLELVEAVDMGDGLGGLVMVGGVKPGSNAEKTGQFNVGDVIYGVMLKGEVFQPNCEGLNYDLTLDRIIACSEKAAGTELVVTVQRVVEVGGAD